MKFDGRIDVVDLVASDARVVGLDGERGERARVVVAKREAEAQSRSQQQTMQKSELPQTPCPGGERCMRRCILSEFAPSIPILGDAGHGASPASPAGGPQLEGASTPLPHIDSAPEVGGGVAGRRAAGARVPVLGVHLPEADIE